MFFVFIYRKEDVMLILLHFRQTTRTKAQRSKWPPTSTGSRPSMTVQLQTNHISLQIVKINIFII